ncbi:unnamed protein product [Rhizophagus irregularis]|nr:unnamed protein product [Rhizophagus irregularis]
MASNQHLPSIPVIEWIYKWIILAVVSSSTTQSHATVECGFRRVWMCEFSNSRRFFLSDLGHGFQWKFRNFLLFGSR